MKFSDRLKGLREKNDMTQEQLAKVSGVSPRTIQRYECGTSRPRLDAAEKLAKALNISVDQLLGTDGMLVAQAAEQYGARGAKQAQQLTDEVTSLFTGGTGRYGCYDASHYGCLLACEREKQKVHPKEVPF